MGAGRGQVQVQSTWFPLVDRNPQTFVDIYTAKESDFKKAMQRVYRRKDMPSAVMLRVLPSPLAASRSPRDAAERVARRGGRHHATPRARGRAA